MNRLYDLTNKIEIDKFLLGEMIGLQVGLLGAVIRNPILAKGAAVGVGIATLREGYEALNDVRNGNYRDAIAEGFGTILFGGLTYFFYEASHHI